MNQTLKLIDYHTWATDLVTNQVLTLPEEKVFKDLGGSFPSIRITMGHLLTADYIWMNRWKGIPRIDHPEDWGTLAELVATWRDVQAQLKDASLVLTPDQRFKFTTSKGITYELPFSDIVLQMTHHGSYHRGQIANMLRMQGETPVSTDYLLFCVK